MTLLLCLSGATACAPAEDASAFGAAGTAAISGDANDVLATLDSLEVKGRAPKTDYSRDEFGQRWRDVDRNGCDTRNDILARDLRDISANGTCTVTSGVLDDPYTATTINFTRGQGTSEAVQIDHVVALSDAWQKGAQQLTPERREQFANDPANLLAVDGPANMQKSDGDAATWLPKNKAFRCTYVSMQVGVKAAYGLWVTRAEKDAMRAVLTSCGDGWQGGEVAPAPEAAGEDAAGAGAVDAGNVAVEDSVADGVSEDAADGVAAGDSETSPAGGVGETYFANCAAARAAGVAPLYAGQPGYRAAMDGDGDGIACE